MKKDDWMDDYEDNGELVSFVEDILKKEFGDNINGEHYDVVVKYHDLGDGRHLVKVNYTDKKGNSQRVKFRVDAWHTKSQTKKDILKFIKGVKAGKEAKTLGTW
jgi:hypothetical protein